MRRRPTVSRRALLAVVASFSLVIAGVLAASPAQAAAPTVTRVAGADRFAAGVALADSVYQTANTVFIANGLNYPDALSSGAVAAKLHAPLLLATPTALPDVVKNELIKLKPHQVYIVGGTASVSPDVESAITKAVKTVVPSVTVTRLAGTDRFDAGRQVVRVGFTSAPKVIISTGLNYPDALSAGAAGGASDAPVILVNGQASSIDTPTTQLLTDLGTTDVTIVGGTASVTPGVQASLAALPGVTVSRIAGADRFDVSTKIGAAYFSAPTTKAYLATGLGFADALAGSAIAGAQGAPLFTVQTNCVPQATLDEISLLGVTSVTLIGGTASLSQSVAQLLPCGSVTSTVYTSTSPIVTGGGQGFFAGASCADSATCVIATQSNEVGGNDPQLLVRDSFGNWVDVVAPLPDAATHVVDADMTSVSCPEAGFCAAGGSYDRGTSGGAFLDVLQDGAWNAFAVPVPQDITIPPDTYVSVLVLSCTSATFCVALASQGSGQGSANWFAIWNGTSWAAQDAPDLAATSATQLSSLSCSTATSCIAVGSALPTGSTDTVPVFETWNGTSWTASAAPAIAGGGGLSEVSCDATGTCVAIGSTASGAGVIALRKSGSWTLSSQLLPGTAMSTSFVSDASCNSGQCLVVGGWFSTDGQHLNSVAQQWNGSSWKRITLATTNGSDTDLNAVSCYAAAACVLAGKAVPGSVTQPTGSPIAVTQSYYQGSVTQSFPTVPAQGLGHLSVLACSAGGFCISGYDNSSGTTPGA